MQRDGAKTQTIVSSCKNNIETGPRTNHKLTPKQRRARFWKQWNVYSTGSNTVACSVRRRAEFPQLQIVENIGEIPTHWMGVQAPPGVGPTMPGIVDEMDQEDSEACDEALASPAVEDGAGVCKASVAGSDAQCAFLPSISSFPKRLGISDVMAATRLRSHSGRP